MARLVADDFDFPRGLDDEEGSTLTALNQVKREQQQQGRQL
jgi:hypothetical protein